MIKWIKQFLCCKHELNIHANHSPYEVYTILELGSLHVYCIKCGKVLQEGIYDKMV